MSLWDLVPNVEVMTPEDEAFVRRAECPQCRPKEGRAEKMQPLGNIMGGSGYQCRRCKHVWVANAEVSDRRPAASDSRETHNGGSLH